MPCRAGAKYEINILYEALHAQTGLINPVQ